jgi:hypothetical protein
MRVGEEVKDRMGVDVQSACNMPEAAWRHKTPRLVVLDERLAAVIHVALYCEVRAVSREHEYKTIYHRQSE